MRNTLLTHMASIAAVTTLVVLMILALEHHEDAIRRERWNHVAPYLGLRFVDFGNPRDRAIFQETLNLFQPRSPATNDSLMNAIDAYREAQFTDPSMKTGVDDRRLSWSRTARLGLMYLQFVGVFALVLALTFYGAQSLAIYRYVRMKQGKPNTPAALVHCIREWRAITAGAGVGAFLLRILLLVGTGAVKIVAAAILFAPAYVVGYSIKTNFETDSLLFMVLLGVVTNGLLVNSANRFYTILVAEGRKGYVETARVKNLHSAYAWHTPDGISPLSIFRLPRRFPGHVFDHIFTNARHQYLPTIKEQASYLITGLIIIEMALNIQGHLCYELLQSILYRQFDVLLVIMLGIFLLVKVTEILVDVRRHHATLQYANTTSGDRDG